MLLKIKIQIHSLLCFFLGSEDSIDNYEEISREKYEEIYNITFLKDEQSEINYIEVLNEKNQIIDILTGDEE